MKRTLIFVFAVCLISGVVQAQGISLSLKKSNIEKVFVEIQKQSGYEFLYSAQMIKDAKPVDINVKNALIEDVLRLCFKDQPFGYTVIEKTVVIKPGGRKLMEDTGVSETTTHSKMNTPIIISGKMLDEDGKILQGVTVSIKGLVLGTTSDQAGNFILPVPENSSAVLVFTSIGYEAQEYKVRKSETLAIVLKKKISQQDEVIVTGYTAQKKKTITGSVSTISEQDLKNVPVTDIYSALKGRVPGLAIRTNSYQPGRNDNSIELRGRTTGLEIGNLSKGAYNVQGMNNFGAGNANPLVIIDGVEGTLDLININDIQSITVLKDASAAIYGIKAANGVILVTTKSGSANGIKLTCNTFVGVQQTPRRIKFLPSWQQAVLVNEALSNEAGGAGGGFGGGGGSAIGGSGTGFGDQLVPISQDSINKYKAGADGFYNTNWEDLFYLPATYTQKHNISISNGNDKTRFNLSLGYEKTDGNVKKVSNTEYLARLNFKSFISTKFNVGGGVNLGYKSIMEPGDNTLSGVGGLMSQIAAFSPMVPAVYGNGAPGHTWGSISPLAWLNSPSFQQSTNRTVNGNLNMNLMPIKGLTLNGLVGFGYGNTSQKLFRSELYAYTGGPKGTPLEVIPYLSNTLSYLNQVENQSLGLQSQVTANYNRYFGNHEISILAGYQVNYTRMSSMSGRKQGLLNDNIVNLNIAPNDGQVLGSSDLETGQKSVFGKVAYNYNDIFFIDYTQRNDAVSAFSPQHYWGSFPAVGVAWLVSNHSFWAKNKKLSDAISYLKLRATRGSLGNSSVGYFSFLRTFSQYNYSFNGQNVPSVFPTQGYNPDITWETTKITNLGVDLRFLRDKMNLSFDWYNKNTTGILAGLGAPISYGLSSVPYENVGSMLNRGVEIQLGIKGNKGDFSWGISGFWTYNQNRITKYKPINRATTLDLGWEQVVGNESTAIYGLEAEGIMQTKAEVDAAPKIGGIDPANYGPGDIRYKDQNKDGVIDYKDRVKLGVATPPVNYGLNMQGAWKKFSIAMLFQGSTGNKAYIGDALGRIGNNANKASIYYWDRWTPENKTNNMPRAFYRYWQNAPNQVFSSFWLRSVSYLRLKTLSIAYDLPVDLCSKIHAKYLRVYYSGQDLATVSNFWKGLDPETSVPTASASSFSAPVIHTIGLNVQF